MKSGYIKVEQDGSLGKRLLNPDWRNDAGERITDDNVFIAQGYYPLYDNPPKVDSRYQYVRGLTREHWVVHDRWVEIPYNVYDKTPEDVFLNQRSTVQTQMAKAMYCGQIDWTHPETGESLSVDLRDKDDADSLMELHLAAQVSGEPVSFRDAQNRTHTLTPAQAADLAKTVLKHLQQCRQEAWSKKDRLKAILNDTRKSADKCRNLVESLQEKSPVKEVS